MKPAKPSVTVLLNFFFFSFNSIRLKFNICLCQRCHRSRRMSSLGLGPCWRLLETRVIVSQTSSPSSWISATLATGNKPNTKSKTRDHSFAHWGATGWDREVSSSWLQSYNRVEVSQASKPIYEKLTLGVLLKAFAKTVAICDSLYFSQIMIETVIEI